MHPDIAGCSSLPVQVAMMDSGRGVCSCSVVDNRHVRLDEETNSQVQVFVGWFGRGTVLLSEGGV